MAVTIPTAAAAADAQADLIAWLSRATDLDRGQVAFVTPDSVYSLEPLGPPLPTGEVIVLVRTEARGDDWPAAHGFRSWDANLLIDCAGHRLRVIRSATYPERNRGGRPSPEPHDDTARTPAPNEPVARLLAAACDADYAWPLRNVAPPSAPPPLVVTTAPAVMTPPPKPAPPAAIAPAPAPRTYAIQVARGSSEEGARRELARARKLLGPLAQTLQDAVPVTRLDNIRIRYEARLQGFATAEAADGACRLLSDAGRDCFRLKTSTPDLAASQAPSGPG